MRKGGAVPVLDANTIRARHAQVENQIVAQGFQDLMINTRADRASHVEHLIQTNRLQEAMDYINRIAFLLPQPPIGGRRPRNTRRITRRYRNRK